MPPRENELPEGTDHIINGAMETNIDTAPASGGTEGGASDAGGGTIGSGTAASAEPGGGFMPAGGDDTGGTSNAGSGGAGGEGGNVVEQLRSQAFALRDQAGDRVRTFADTGKTRATDALEELSRVFADTADSIDERLGGEYGEYARRASDSVSGFADTLRGKEVDEIYENVVSAVRKSPGVAIGIAAVAGFALARVVKAGFEPAGATGKSTNGTTGGSDSGTGA